MARIKSRKNYTREFKLEVVREVETTDCTVKEVASRYAINHDLIYQWRKKFLDEGVAAFSGKGKLSKKDAEVHSKDRRTQEYWNMTGLPIDIQHIDRDIYYLLVLFSASKSLASQETGDADAVRTLRDQFEKSEATKQLISVAVCVRNRIDVGCPGPTEYRKPLLHKTVGILKQEDKKTELCFRDACHKIIHARGLTFVTRSAKGFDYIVPKVILWGEHRDVEWEAMVDVIKFASLAYNLNM